MQALKYMVGFLLLVHNAPCYANELQDLENFRTPYPRYEISDIFGAAKLIESLLQNSDRLKELLKDPIHILQATVLVGSIAAVVKISLQAVQGLSASLPHVIKQISRRILAYCMRVCNIPVGFDMQQVLICEQLFEQMMTVWCDQAEQAEKSEKKPDVYYWDFNRGFIRDMLDYQIHFIESHQHYYHAIQLKKVVRYETFCQSDTAIDLICFLIQSSVTAMKQLKVICERAEQFEDFDVEQVRMIAQNVIILLKKLRACIHESAILSYNQSEYNVSGQLFMPTSSSFDV